VGPGSALGGARKGLRRAWEHPRRARGGPQGESGRAIKEEREREKKRKKEKNRERRKKERKKEIKKERK
jgi:hypothetical protein